MRLARADWVLIGISIVIAIASIVVVAYFFEQAFPEASIDFRYDRTSSKEIADRLARAQGIAIDEMKHAARFDADHIARIFLERSLGLERANRITSHDVRVWYWHHRWFQPLVEEEISVDVAPTGEIVGFRHRIAEDAPSPAAAVMASDPAVLPGEFLRAVGVNFDDLRLVEESQRQLPRRIQRTYTFESRTVRPADAPYRHTITVDGNSVTGYSQRLKVPDAWIRSYRELRSKNAAAGSVDMILMIATLIAAVVFFVIRLRRGDLALRFLLGVAAASVLLVGAVSLNSIPAQLSYYDTTTSYPAFVGRLALQATVQSLGTAMLLIVVVGAGEVLYRERLPRQLAMPRIWTPRALTSRRVFRSLILGYALVPLFIAYQVTFYVTARRFGAWAPAQLPYDEILNSALPWAAVLFAGFFPAFSEEFLSRAFSIPFFQRIVRSRVTAIVIAGFIWGFGHSTYPNQPFWIRGVEVGIAGVAAGFLMDRFGLLPLLIWHYTIDAVYTATLLFSSGNRYYIVSAAVTSLIFAFPLLATIALYVRNRGFVPDDDLTNASLPLSAPPAARPATALAAAQFPEPMRPTRRLVAGTAILLLAAVLAFVLRPASPSDAIDFRITREQAKTIARAHVVALRGPSFFARDGGKPEMRIVAAPVEGFRSWNRDSAREEGGAPGGFDEIAASHLVHSGMSINELLGVFRTKIETGNWVVRFFVPEEKEEIFVEVDPRTSRVLSYHLYQDEKTRGLSLRQDQAMAIAARAFRLYGLDPEEFRLREALSFQQPARRDWLLHFEERQELTPRSFMRVTVRVAGARVTQFVKTIHIPESVYREAATERALNVVLFIVKIAGIVLLLAIVVAGLVVAARVHGLPWRRALRWTLALSPVPIASFAVRYESMLFGYSTSVAWETFQVSLMTAFVRDVGLQMGLLFLALAGLQAAFPYSLDLLRRESRARFGRSAALAALAAVAILVSADVLSRAIAHAFPRAASVEITASSDVAIPLPALFAATEGVFAAIILSAAVALYAVAVRKRTGTITMVLLFCAAIDPLATAEQLPLMLGRAAAMSLLIWLIARYVLNANPLAWPLAFFLAAALQHVAVLFHNNRPDLLANGVALVALIVAVILWIVSDSDRERRATDRALIR